MSRPAAAVPSDRYRAGDHQVALSSGDVANGMEAGGPPASGSAPATFGGVGSGVIVTSGFGDTLVAGLGRADVVMGTGLMAAGLVGASVVGRVVVGAGFVVGGLVGVCAGITTMSIFAMLGAGLLFRAHDR